jgi:hypothetical protein
MPGKTAWLIASPMKARRRTMTYAPIAPQVAPITTTSASARRTKS